MDLSYLGGGCVRISGKSLTVICDPYTTELGLGNVTAKADLVTRSQSEGLGKVNGVERVFEQPGEYELKGVSVVGVPARLHIDETGYRGTVFGFDMDGITVVVAGNTAGKLEERQLERLGTVHVLVVPVGNHGLTMDATSAAELVTQLEPSYVVPVHYDDGKTTYPVPQDGVEVFLKEMGAGTVEPVAKLKVNAKELPEEPQIVVLSRS